MNNVKFYYTKLTKYIVLGEKYFAKRKHEEKFTEVDITFFNDRGHKPENWIIKCQAQSLDEALILIGEINGKAKIKLDELKAIIDAEYFTFINECKELVKSGQIIESTEDNIRKVLYGLNEQNWGSWTLPKMTISYSANQYDCDGKTATTIRLASAILIDGEKVSKFKTATNRGHLNDYYSLR